MTIREASESFQETRNIRDLGSLLQYLKTGMFRWEVENLLGEPTASHPYAGSLYEIRDLRKIVKVNGDESVTMPVYLQVEYEGDKLRRDFDLRSRGSENNDIPEARDTDKLLSFAMIPIGE